MLLFICETFRRTKTESGTEQARLEWFYMSPSMLKHILRFVSSLQQIKYSMESKKSSDSSFGMTLIIASCTVVRILSEAVCREVYYTV